MSAGALSSTSSTSSRIGRFTAAKLLRGPSCLLSKPAVLQAQLLSNRLMKHLVDELLTHVEHICCNAEP